MTAQRANVGGNPPALVGPVGCMWSGKAHYYPDGGKLDCSRDKCSPFAKLKPKKKLRK